MELFEQGRSGSIWKYYKDENVRDIIQPYFAHPIWEMKAGDPLPDMPLDVQFEFVNRCNLHCTSCSVDDQRRDKKVLEWDVMERLVDEAAEEGVCYITVCGLGEATLHPDLFRFFARVRSRKVEKKGLRVMDYMPTLLISNGMWSTAQINACLENPPDVISFSLAGLTDEEFDERRRGIRMDRFRHVLSRLFNERKVVRGPDGGLSPTIHLSTHIYPHEMETRADEVEAFIEEWFEMADIVVIKPTMIHNDKTPPAEFSAHQSLIEKHENLKYTRLAENVYERTAPCFETSRRLSINSDGEVWCGHHMSEDFGGFLGNVHENTLREIWHGEPMNAFRRAVRAGRFDREACKRCGGEIRDFHRDREPELETELVFRTS